MNNTEEFDTEFMDIHDIIQELYISINNAHPANIHVDDFHTLIEASMILIESTRSR